MKCTPRSSAATVPEPGVRATAFAESSANRSSKVFTGSNSRRRSAHRDVVVVEGLLTPVLRGVVERLDNVPARRQGKLGARLAPGRSTPVEGDERLLHHGAGGVADPQVDGGL